VVEPARERELRGVDRDQALAEFVQPGRLGLDAGLRDRNELAVPAMQPEAGRLLWVKIEPALEILGEQRIDIRRSDRDAVGCRSGAPRVR